MKTILDEYRRLVKICESTDYGNKNSVRVHNRAADKMYKLVERAGQEGMESIEILATLLDEPVTKEWLAFQLLDRVKVNPVVENKCLSIIKIIAEDKSRLIDSFGAQVWLDKWHQAKK